MGSRPRPWQPGPRGTPAQAQPATARSCTMCASARRPSLPPSSWAVPRQCPLPAGRHEIAAAAVAAEAPRAPAGTHGGCGGSRRRAECNVGDGGHLGRYATAGGSAVVARCGVGGGLAGRRGPQPNLVVQRAQGTAYRAQRGESAAQPLPCHVLGHGAEPTTRLEVHDKVEHKAELEQPKQQAARPLELQLSAQPATNQSFTKVIILKQNLTRRYSLGQGQAWLNLSLQKRCICRFR